MLDSGPQLIYTFSRVRQEIDGPKRSFLTRAGREGDPDGQVYHAPELCHAKQFDSPEAARYWRDGQRREVRKVMDRLGFTLTGVAAQVVPLPAMAPADATAGLSDADIDAMTLRNALEDTVDGALGDAGVDAAIEDTSDEIAAEALGMPLDTFRRMLDLAAAGMDRDADRDSRAVEMAARSMVTPAPVWFNHDAEARRAQLERLWATRGSVYADEAYTVD